MLPVDEEASMGLAEARMEVRAGTDKVPGLSAKEVMELEESPARVRREWLVKLKARTREKEDSKRVRMSCGGRELESKAREWGLWRRVELAGTTVLEEAAKTEEGRPHWVALPTTWATVPSGARERTVRQMPSIKWRSPVRGWWARAMGATGAESQGRPRPKVGAGKEEGSPPVPASTARVP